MVLPFGRTDYKYTVEGWVYQEDRQFSIAPAGVTLSATKTYKASFNLLGQPTQLTHADDPTSPSVTTLTYDERGLPFTLSRVVGNQSTLLGQLERNLAGEVTLRTSGFAQGQTWSYDDLGRVVSESFRSCSQGAVPYATSKSCAQTGTTVVGGEALSYYRSGDVKSVSDTSTGQKLTYTFDAQHQLASARSTPDATLYSGDFTYTPGGRVASAKISSSNATTDVRPRDVLYSYPAVTDTTNQVTDASPSARLAVRTRRMFPSFAGGPWGRNVHRHTGPPGGSNGRNRGPRGPRFPDDPSSGARRSIEPSSTCP